MALRMAAQSAGCSGTALGAFYLRLRARLGSPKAISATAHTLARIFYHLWTTGGKYYDLGADYYEHRHRQRVIANLRKTASYLGSELTSQSVAPDCVS